jgi:SNF2 family DNA or RNA helicase
VQSGPSSHRAAGLWLASGGEGGNFQFADAVVHYDQPWQRACVEQRIGRLDRIRRTRYRKDALSLVICAAATIEEALGLLGSLGSGTVLTLN